MHLITNTIQKQKPASLTSKRTNWELFDNPLNEEVNPDDSLKSKEEIDDTVENVTMAIEHVTWEATPGPNTTNNTSNAVKKCCWEK